MMKANKTTSDSKSVRVQATDIPQDTNTKVHNKSIQAIGY